VRQAHGTLWCAPLVEQLLDATTPVSIDPAGGTRPSRHYLLDIDDHDHFVLVASRRGTDGTETPIALARCVRLGGSRIGVASILVRSDLRRRGIGTRLFSILRSHVQARGIDGFRFDVVGHDIAPWHGTGDLRAAGPRARRERRLATQS
jgi:GNAT superfamily N-acetyltransferase